MARTTLYDADGRPVEVDLEDEGANTGPGDQRSNAEWAALRRERKQREDAERTLNDYKRRDIFRQVGIDPDDPKQQYFVKGYDGKDSVEDIRAAALAGGFIQADAQAAEAAQQQAQGAPAQGQAAGPPQMSAEALQAAALAAQQTISASAMGAAVIPQTGVAALDDAYAKGGVEAMLTAAESMGVPVVRTNDGV